MRAKTGLLFRSADISDQVWALVQFWSPFSQTIIGNRFIQCLDEITVIAAQIKKAKRIKKIQYQQKIILLKEEGLVWLDKSRRRRLINNDDYQKLYKQIKSLDLFLKIKLPNKIIPTRNCL